MSEKLSAREIVDRGFAVGMHQHREEIEGLVELLQAQSPLVQHVLEIGSLHGGTATCWNGLQAHLGSTVSVVAMDLPEGRFGGKDHGYGSASKRLERAALFQRYGMQIIEGDSHDAVVINRVAIIAKYRPFDFLFIDGDHSLPGVAADYEMYRRFVRPGGLIAFHDINFTKFHLDAGCYVHVLWENISGCLPVTKGDRQFFNIDQPHQPNGWVFSIGAEWGGIGCLETPK